ncbi:Cysteine/O-acetylserine efflux protein [Listeria grayi]|uniref:Homoserine/threonine resistance transporter n=1 Tax=Listeria grayi FSL F6-1183 TaxID=1265827 RepID=A0A829R9E9_LISGR|nr:LysE family translocator [Listeria grayi]EUJ28586.1 homoserine/threonine resistance transporter [Listeria grayi FSL F6-1183]VEI30371.1 Cysteine/O-acetylserine efflux protein [Listeria grayi]
MTILLTLFYAFFMSFTPGPNNILAMRYATSLGMKPTLRFLVGIGAGFLTLSIFSLFFNTFLLTITPVFYVILKLVGFLYLLYLAYQMMFTAHKSKQTTEKHPTFLQGYILQFLNPKTILYVVTAMGTYVIPHTVHYLALILWVAVIALLGFLASYTWAFLGCKICRFLVKHEHAFNLIMSIILVILAVEILFS